MANFFQNAFEKTKNFANQAVDGTKNAAQKSKLKSRINQENSNIERQFTEIGRYYYNINKEQPAPEVAQFFENINSSLNNIAACNQEIQNIEAQEALTKQQNAHPGYTGYPQQQIPPQGMMPPQGQMPSQGMAQPPQNNDAMFVSPVSTGDMAQAGTSDSGMSNLFATPTPDSEMAEQETAPSPAMEGETPAE